MTVIAYDGAKLASDGLGCFGDERHRTDIAKVVAINTPKRKCAYGFSGASGLMQPVIAWFENGADPGATPTLPAEATWSLLVVEFQGDVLLFTKDVPYPTEVKAPFAMGSGGDFAVGALHAGADAARAVEVACRLDVYCGGDIKVIDLHEAFLPKTVSAVNPKTGKRIIRLESVSG